MLRRAVATAARRAFLKLETVGNWSGELGSELLFLIRLLRPVDLAGASRAAKLRFDRRAKPARPIGMLALHMSADGSNSSGATVSMTKAR